MKNIFRMKERTEMHYSWKNIAAWSLLGFIFALIVIMTFMRTPEQIMSKLTLISSQLKYYFLATHIVMFLLLGAGIVWKRYRNQIFFAMLLLLSLSSTVVSSIFVVIPNIIFFGAIMVLVLLAYATKNLKFELKKVKILDWVFSSIGLLFGFWYLHWIDSPIALNALLYSPLGGVNCPTLVMMSALLIITKRSNQNMLSTFVGALTIYFGFFGMIIIGAYVDLVLILCGMYLVGKNLFNWITNKKEERSKRQKLQNI